MAKKKQWVLIGGYGEIGSWNWGFNTKEALAQSHKWYDECTKNIGKTVMLTGGGSFYKAWTAKLTSVFWRDWGEDKVVAVRLEKIKPRWSIGKEPNIFEPTLGSWQISIKM